MSERHNKNRWRIMNRTTPLAFIAVTFGVMLLTLARLAELVEVGGLVRELLLHIGIAFVAAAVIVFSAEWAGLINKNERFVDADPPIRGRQDERQFVDLLLQEIRTLKISDEAPDYGNIVEEAVRKALATHSQGSPNSFSGYFGTITALLQEKADVSDRKASILLDRGIAYTKFGIGFYIVSIMVWQFLAWSGGVFKPQFVYGIASCSLLFIFIEFLSAWFLKQYRHFVDTSTFLIKLKAVFDKYMLVYLVSKEYPVESQLSQEAAKSLLGVLVQEIGWPDSFIFDGKNGSFAKETVEALALLSQSLRKSDSARKESSA